LIVAFNSNAQKDFKKLDKSIKNKIDKFLIELETLENPKSKGKPLIGNLSNLWRYRVGDYRLVCEIQDDKLIILVLGIGHRKNIYNLKV
jgi:mRNA interferase RelE/StbE